MITNLLEKLFEHNNWANTQIIQACATLSNEQLDAEPDTAVKGNVRNTLWHLVDAQQDYLYQLTDEPAPFQWQSAPSFAELQQAADISGAGLLSLAGNVPGMPQAKIYKAGYSIEPWILIVQAINHATEHREQIKSMLSALGVNPPRIDGWEYGNVTSALIKLPNI